MEHQNVRKGEELHLAKLKRFLFQQELIKDVETPLQVTQFTQGYSNLTYLLKIEDKEYVLRRPPFGAVKHGHDMGREYRVQKAIYPSFSKVPKMYAYTEDTEVLGAPFYIMEKVAGIILGFKEAEKRQLPASDFSIIANSWMDTFVALHQLDYKAVGLSDLGRPEGYVARQITNWGKQYLKAATDEVPAAEKVMTWMEAHQPKKYQHSYL